MEPFAIDDLQMELMALDGKGYHCSQILLLLGLRQMERENADLLRSMGGLSYGLGHSNETCGALLGGAALLGLYCGKGTDGEREHDMFRMMVRRLVEWFRDELCSDCGSTKCGDILNVHGRSKCGLLVRSVWEKCMELLEENDVDLPEGRDDDSLS